MASPPQPKSMQRAKVWSIEAEEAWRFQVAGYKDALDYQSVKNEVVRWPENGFIKKLQRKDGNWYYYNKARELPDKDLGKTKLYVY